MRGVALAQSIAIILVALAAPALAQKPMPADVARQLEFSKPVPMDQVMVDLRSGVDPPAFARFWGLTLRRPMKSLDNAFVMGCRSIHHAKWIATQLTLNPYVEWVFQDELHRGRKASFSPNDPYYPYNSPPNHYGQWHLRNEANVGGASIDARVWPAWQRDITGRGIVVGVIDDSFEISHPDLAPAYVPEWSWDFVDNDADPSPTRPEDDHGTPVAGLAVARGGNGLGVTGVAPFARFAGLKHWPELDSISAEVDAILFHSSGTQVDLPIKNHSYGSRMPYQRSSIRDDALRQSIGFGTIHVFSAMNERGKPLQDANGSDRTNEPGIVVVAGLGADGRFASYSNFGASITTTAPTLNSNPGQPSWGLTTTDNLGESGSNIGRGSEHIDPDYTKYFSGTSGSAPIVSGVMALVKEVQPALDGRFAKHLLTLCSDIVDPDDSTWQSDGGWKANAAGRMFNQNYGFGLINADRLTLAAPEFRGTTLARTIDTGEQLVGADLPDAEPTGVVREFTIQQDGRLEEVEINIKAVHGYSGDIEAYITSPSGLSSRLISSNTAGVDGMDWTFMTNAFWGEQARGVWSLRVADVVPEDAGVWTAFSARLHTGQLVPNRSYTGLSTSSPEVIGGETTPMTLSLDRPAPVGGLNIKVASGSPAASTPEEVFLPEGQTSIEITVTSSPVSSDTMVSLTATSPIGSISTNLLVRRPTPVSLTLSERLIRGGQTPIAEVLLNGAAPSGGLRILLRSNRLEAAVPTSITIPEGERRVSFQVQTTKVPVIVQPTLYATANRVTRFVLLVLLPPRLTELTLLPATAASGSAAVGRIRIAEAAGSSGVAVTVRSSNPAAATSALSFTIPAGETDLEFPITVGTVSTRSTAWFNATIGNETLRSALTVMPPLVSSVTATPSNLTSGHTALITITLASPAPSGGLPVAIRSSSPLVSVPNSILVPSGRTESAFAATAGQVGSPQNALIYATVAGHTRFATLVLRP